jgi:multiple sugar transport system permease protein
MKRRTAASTTGSGAKYLVLLLYAAWTLVPIFVVVTNSFKTEMDIFTVPFKLLFTPTLGNYQRAFALGEFGRYFLNSTIIAVSSSLLSVGLGVLAAYGFTNIRERHARVLNVILIVGKSVPAITMLLPLFVILSKVHLLGTYFGPIITHTSVNLPFVIWLIIGFINDIPADLSTAAEIDGCTKMQALWFIIIPILTPALSSAVILSLQYSWNEFMFSLMLTNIDTYTLPAGISKFVGSISVDWGKSSAAATVTMVPIIIAGFFAQKYLVRGMTLGAVKG